MRKCKNIVAVCLAMMMTLSLTACSGTEENGGIYTLEPEDIVMEPLNEETDQELQEMESQETGFPEDIATEEDLDTEKDNAGQDEREDTEQNAGEAANNNVDQTANAAEEPVVSDEANIAPQQSAETPAVDRRNSQQAQNVSAPSTTIVGSIKSLGDGSFSISRANVNSNVMVSTDETVNVVYSDSTEFEVCTSTDGGITAGFTAGTSADLQTGRLVDIEGAYEGSDFVAQKITIRIFG